MCVLSLPMLAWALALRLLCPSFLPSLLFLYFSTCFLAEAKNSPKPAQGHAGWDASWNLAAKKLPP